MQKSKFWILLFVVSCAPKNPPRLVTGSWLQKQKAFIAQRVPASETSATCKKDLYTTEEVKREALQYEAQLNTGEKISGTWKHLDLEKLPVPQAKFLKEVGDNVGDVNSLNDRLYSHCKDAACVVNTVYQSRDGLEGWVIYLWYLKMGNILSFKNKVYNQKDARGGVYNNASYLLEDYLFSRDELQVFWRLSDLLPVSFKTLPYLKEIQRVPRDASFEQAQFSASCGISYHEGYIPLTAKCLNLDQETITYHNGKRITPINNDEALAHWSITHEMAHQIDFQWGREGKIDPQFSKTKTWMDMGQWHLQEYRDTNGSLVQNWTTTLDPKYFISEYAKKDAIEHFAETASHYYYSPEETKKIVPQQTYQFISQNIFGGLEYDKISSLKRFEKAALLKMAPKLLDLKPDCASSLDEEEDSSQPNPTKKRPIIYPRRKPQSIDEAPCLAKPLEKLLSQAVAEAKLNNTNGCLVLKSSKEENLFSADMKEAFIEQIKDHSKISLQAPEQTDQLGQFYEKLKDRSAPLKILTDCHGQRNEKGCYEEELQSEAEKSVPPDLKENSDLDSNLQKNYIAANSYESVKSENLQLYRDFVFSQAALLDSSAASLWGNCLVEIDNSEMPIAGLFSVGEKWMVSSQINCLNKEIPLTLKRLITEMTFDSMKVADEMESAILFDITLPLFIKELTRLYERDAQLENNRIALATQKLRPQQIKLLTQSFFWVNGLGTKMSEACKNEVARGLPQDLRYFDPKDVFKNHIQEVCSQVANSKAFKNWATSRPDLITKDVQATYLEVLLKEAEKKADQCEEAYPANNFVTRLFKKEKRSRCYQENWEEVEKVAWAKASSKYPSSKFQSSLLLQQISSEAQVVKDDVQIRRF